MKKIVLSILCLFVFYFGQTYALGTAGFVYNRSDGTVWVNTTGASGNGTSLGSYGCIFSSQSAVSSDGNYFFCIATGSPNIIKKIDLATGSSTSWKTATTFRHLFLYTSPGGTDYLYYTDGARIKRQDVVQAGSVIDYGIDSYRAFYVNQLEEIYFADANNSDRISSYIGSTTTQLTTNTAYWILGKDTTHLVFCNQANHIDTIDLDTNAVTTSIAGTTCYYGSALSYDKSYLLYGNVDDSFAHKTDFPLATTGTAWTTNSVYSIATIYQQPSFASCSDGILNQDETAIDFGGTCSTVQFCASGSTVTSYTYPDITYTGGTISTRENFQVGAGEHGTLKRDGVSWYNFGQSSYFYDIETNNDSYSGTLANFMTGSSSLFYSGATDLTFDYHLYFYSAYASDEKVFDLSASGSHAVNYVKVNTNRNWHLEARYISNQSYETVTIDNVKDADYTVLPTSSGSVALLPLGYYTRDFRVVFEDTGDYQVNSITYGKYTENRTVSQECTIVAKHDLEVFGPGILDAQSLYEQTQNAIRENLLDMTGSTSGDFAKMFGGCPSQLDDVNISTFSFLNWGFAGTVPVIGYKFDLRPFSPIACPIKSLIILYNKF